MARAGCSCVGIPLIWVTEPHTTLTCLQVPGRLGLLVTLYLIAINVYNSVEIPTKSGFSFIEIWMIGIQVPILVGIFEYGIVLAMKKYQACHSTKIIKVGPEEVRDTIKLYDMYLVSKNVDKWTFLGSLVFILMFNMIYWCTSLNVQ